MSFFPARLPTYAPCLATVIRTPLDELKTAVSAGEAVFVVGTGVTTSAVPKFPGTEFPTTWKGLIQHGLEFVEKNELAESEKIEQRRRNLDEATEAQEFVDVAGWLERTLGTHCYLWLKESIGSLVLPERSPVHEAIARLPGPITTTNYDSLLEDVRGYHPVTWQDSPAVADALYQGVNSIVHLNGWWKRPDTVVLGPVSYAEMLGDDAFRASIQARFFGRSIVFVGCGDGLEDPLFESIFTWLQEVQSVSVRAHFRLCRDQDLTSSAMDRGRRIGIRPVSYGSKYTDLAPFLESLALERDPSGEDPDKDQLLLVGDELAEVALKLVREFDSFDEEAQQELLNAIEELIQDDAKIIGKRRGCVELRIEIPRAKVEELVWACKLGDLHDHGVADIRYVAPTELEPTFEETSKVIPRPRRRVAPARPRPPRKPTRAGMLANVLSIASGKGGTGKSLLATNIAVELSEAGNRVLLVDMDLGLANAQILLGASPRHSLADVVMGRIDVAGAIEQTSSGVDLLSGGLGAGYLIDPVEHRFSPFFEDLAREELQYDWILVDHPAGLNSLGLHLLTHAPALLLVLTEEKTAFADVYVIFKRATIANPSIAVGVVLNNIRDKGDAAKSWAKLRNGTDRYLSRSPELVGTVPSSDLVLASIDSRAPFCLTDPESAPASAVRLVTRSSLFLDQQRRAPVFSRVAADRVVWERAIRTVTPAGPEAGRPRVAGGDRPGPEGRVRIGEILVRTRLISPAIRDELLAEQRRTNDRFGALAVANDHVTREELEQALRVQVLTCSN